MKTLSVLGLISAGILVGIVGSTYLSDKSPSSGFSPAVKSPSPATIDKQAAVIETSGLMNKSYQANPFVTRKATSSSVIEDDRSFSSAGTSSTPDSMKSDSMADFPVNRMPRPVNITRPDTAENTFQVFGQVGALTWEPSTNSDYENFQIQLSGPDNITINRDFYYGEVASITESLPDGYYKWQAVTTPAIDPYVKQEMRAARESGDLIAEEKLKQRFRSEGLLLTRDQAKNNVQSGGFRVANGEMFDRSVKE